MDRRIENNLENYLRGSLDPRARSEFEGLLESDAATRRMVEDFERHAKMIRASLRPGESPGAGVNLDPAPGFYGRLMDRIEAQRGGSFWNLILEPRFFQRLAFASASLLVLLGLMLAVPSGEQTIAAGPEHFLAQEEAQDLNVTVEHQGRNRDALLVNLTTYGE